MNKKLAAFFTLLTITQATFPLLRRAPIARTAAVVAIANNNDRPYSYAEVEYRERKDRKKTLEKEINETEKELKQARKEHDDKRVHSLEQKKDQLKDKMLNL